MTISTALNGWWSNFRTGLTPNDQQRRILWMIGVMLLVITIMYQFRITRLVLYPFEIIVLADRRKVESIDINMDESGLTRFTGGWYCAIVPAGYIGSSLIGCVLLATGFSQFASRIMAGVVGFILAITCIWAGSIMTLVMALCLAGLLALAVWYEEGKYTQYLTLFMGTIASVVSLLNIISSTVFHTIDGSDATAFAKHCSILVPASVFGMLWLLISVASIALSLCLAVRFTK